MARIKRIFADNINPIMKIYGEKSAEIRPIRAIRVLFFPL